MLRRHNRLLITFYVLCDALSAAVSFIAAYLIRFDSPFTRLVPVTKDIPPFTQYALVVPLVAVLVPLAFHVQGLYRLRRGRTRVDDFFAVLEDAIGDHPAEIAGANDEDALEADAGAPPPAQEVADDLA